MNLPKKNRTNERVKYLTVCAVLFWIEVLIAIFVHDDLIRPYIGDILVVIVLYCAIRSVIPNKCKFMPLWIFLFAAFVECLQYFKFVQVLGLEDNVFLRILLGSTFDVKDIACYGSGCIILGIYEWLIRK